MRQDHRRARMPPGWRAVAAVALASIAWAATAHAQTDLATILPRVAAYVQTFERQFGSMVAEEKYDQFVLVGNTAAIGVRGFSSPSPAHTTLRSDFLLVQLPGEGWVPFRDVFERDGKAVRDRQDRLTALFLKPMQDALAQARRITEESARYNIGNIERTMNVPTLALVYLAGDYQPRMSFSDGKPDDAAPGRVIAFKETARPTFIHTAQDRDLFVTGRAWVDEATGAVHRTELQVIDPSVSAFLTVTFKPDDGSAIWLPEKMEERYRRPRDTSELRGVATYSRFRHFSVSTSQEIKN